MSLPNASQSSRMPDDLWEKVKPFLPAGKQQEGGEQAVVADQEVGAEDREREDENGEPEHSGKDEPVPVQASVSFLMPFRAHRGLSCCMR